MEKNTHPNRNWRKSFRIQPDSVPDYDDHKAWEKLLEDYMRVRNWDYKTLADMLNVEMGEVLGWVQGRDYPPPYLMLALSALD